MLRHWTECSTDPTVDRSLVDAFAPVRARSSVPLCSTSKLLQNELTVVCRFKVIAWAKRVNRATRGATQTVAVPAVGDEKVLSTKTTSRFHAGADASLGQAIRDVSFIEHRTLAMSVFQYEVSHGFGWTLVF